MRCRVRCKRRWYGLWGEDVAAVPMSMAIVVASLAFWIRSYLRRSVRERNVEMDRLVLLMGVLRMSVER